MMYQDIHIADRELWQKILSLWQEEKYSEAFEIISESVLQGKIVNKAVINVICDALRVLQSQHKDIKTNKIQTVNTVPFTSTNGTVYFEIQ